LSLICSRATSSMGWPNFWGGMRTTSSTVTMRNIFTEGGWTRYF